MILPSEMRLFISQFCYSHTYLHRVNCLQDYKPSSYGLANQNDYAIRLLLPLSFSVRKGTDCRGLCLFGKDSPPQGCILF